MSFLSKDYSGRDPDLIPTGIVWARCSRDPQPLAAWAALRTGQVIIADGTGYHRPEYVGEYAAPGDPERERVLDDFRRNSAPFGPGNLPVSKPVDKDGSYWREVLSCPRPSCEYRVELGRRGSRLVRELVLALADSNSNGQEPFVDGSQTPTLIVELHEFLRRPESTFAGAALTPPRTNLG